MNNIEHLNRLFLYAHPRSSSPSARLLSVEEDAVDDPPFRILFREYSTFFLVDVFLRGVSWDDVNVSATVDSLKIFATVMRGERILLVHSAESIHHIGSITRYLRLPVKIDPGAMESKIADGVLQLRLPKEKSLY